VDGGVAAHGEIVEIHGTAFRVTLQVNNHGVSRYFLRTYLDGHPKKALCISSWDQSLTYIGPDRYQAKYYHKLISTVDNAKSANWQSVSISNTAGSSAATYVKNRWYEFIDTIQTHYQSAVTKLNFPLLCGEWLKRKHHAQKGRKGADHCGIKTVQNWATAVCKGFTLNQNSRKRKHFKSYPGLLAVLPNWGKICKEIKRAAPLRRAGEPKNWLRQSDLIQLWIEVFKKKKRSDFQGLETLNDGQYLALHDKFSYATCTRGGETVRVLKSNDPEHNRTHIGLYQNNLCSEIYDTDLKEKYPTGLRDGVPRGMARRPAGLVGWLDRQKNETMVSGDVHNKFYMELSDSIPQKYVDLYPCLGFCNNRFVIETLLNVRIPAGTTRIPMRSDGIAPLFPVKEHVPMINNLLDCYDRGDPIDPADLAKYFVNVDKTWVDKIRKDVFKELISDPDRLANVSGHCWRGGLQPCALSSRCPLQHERKTSSGRSAT